jgi:hypothetical protein
MSLPSDSVNPATSALQTVYTPAHLCGFNIGLSPGNGGGSFALGLGWRGGSLGGCFGARGGGEADFGVGIESWRWGEHVIFF